MQNSHETPQVVGVPTQQPSQQQQQQPSDLHSNNLPIKHEHYGAPSSLPPPPQRNPMEVSEQEKEALHQYRVQPKYESNMIKNEYKRYVFV